MLVKPSDTSSYLGSIAFGCFIAVFEGLSLTRHEITPEVGMTLWIVFTLLLGFNH